MPLLPLCFVVMPFGKKPDPKGGPEIDFDAVYALAIKPAIEDAGLEPCRADGELVGGMIDQAMYERLILAEYAVADLTTLNPNVMFEIGVRYAVRPATTVPIFAGGHTLPFDVAHVRALPYALGGGNSFGAAEATTLRAALGERMRALVAAQKDGPIADSPVFQLVDGFQAPDLSRLKTDVFRQRAAYAERVKLRLQRARSAKDAAEVGRVEAEQDIANAEAGVLVDLLLSWRALGQWDRMIALVGKLPPMVQRTVMVQEQFGFALNRAGRRDDAIRVLQALIAERGPSSETNGLLGRVFKDLWVDAGDTPKAAGHLRKAIATYLAGFEADWRDAYPGINAVTLLDIEGSAASLARRDELLPVVRFAVDRRIQARAADYWDHATLVELAALGDRAEEARRHLGDALAARREDWESDTTANNLRLIRKARAARGAPVELLDELVAALTS